VPRPYPRIDIKELVFPVPRIALELHLDDSRVADDTWHNVSVVVGTSDVGVFLDDQFILRWDGALDRTYDWFGFSGATGAATNWHIIDNFSITASAADLPPAPSGMNVPPPPPTPMLPRAPTLISISTDASSSEVGSTVNINGRLTDANDSLLGANKTIILSYAVGNSESWFQIGSGQTDALGEYNIQWVPAASGTFLLRTEWSGDTTYSGTSNSTTLSFLPYQNQKVFCVESNSTVTGLEFNDSNRTLTFTVSGPNGTIGYTKVVTAKSLISDASGITTLVDGKAVNVTVSSTNETWILEFTYHHSTHQVNINLNSQAEKNPKATHEVSPSILGLALMTAMASAAIPTVIAKRRKMKRSDN